MPFRPSLLLSAVSSLLVACVANPAPVAEWRVLVKVVRPGTSAEVVVRRAAEASGVPVRYVAAVSPQWHGLSLGCGDEYPCAEALRRLKADTSFFEAVERDDKRRPHSASSNAS